MNYDGTTLEVIISDTNTGASDTQNYTVNIPSVVGGSTAFVGFTGADRRVHRNARHPYLDVRRGSGHAPSGADRYGNRRHRESEPELDGFPGAATYNIYRSTTAGGEGSTPFQTGVNGTSFTDFDVVGGTTYFYEVTGVGIGGEGPRSTEVSATPSGRTRFLQRLRRRKRCIDDQRVGEVQQRPGARVDRR